MSASKFRPPRFDVISSNWGNAGDNDRRDRDEPKAEVDFLTFIKNAAQAGVSDLSRISSDSEDVPAIRTSHDDCDGDNGDPFATIEEEGKGEDPGVKLTDESAGREHDRDFTMRAKLEEGIAMLEPHIAAYRKRVNENDEECEDEVGVAPSNTPIHIPPQLLRVVRFFPFKWMPMKLALLRPPSKNEVGKSTRLSLARELYQKGLLTLAEFDILEQSFYTTKDDDGGVDEHDIDCDNYSTLSSSGHDLSRKRKRNAIAHQGKTSRLYNSLKITFSRLPLEAKNPSALRHMKSILYDYCERLNEDTDGAYIFQSNDRDENLPSPEEVSEWALMAFSGVVVANGLDEPRQTDSDEYIIESKLVNILTQPKGDMNVPKYCYFAETLGRKIKEMFEPPLLDQLSCLNILCLARICSYMDSSIVEEHFAHSLDACRRYGGGSGFASLPKLIATYTSIISKQNSSFSYTSFEAGVKKKTAKIHKRGQCGDEDLTSVIFSLSNYLIKEASNRKINKERMT